MHYNPAQSAPKIVRGKNNRVQHHPSLPKERIYEFFQRLEKYPNRKTQLGLQLLILTFVRVGELRGGKWEELKDDEWHIPEERMKMGRPHIVPLSDWSLDILAELRTLNKHNSPYIITGNKNSMMSDNTFSLAMKKMGYKGIAVPHGFRSMASSILNESGLFNPDAIERQLAHAESNAVRAAYNRAEYLEERKKMVQWYSDFIREQSSK
ncbi:tyrosine-type recombinase/integrase [Suttonella ornithocola]|uniref:Prophage CP4-57 integrase n=1 Tax=Suttonella ornithocola TaxID=279832 RepID=A0A380MU54_9GAMM|nr:site-specific integrase [Suttonella ornithocola]SUO96130.1 Prophage CP4-57 integrase [Suttonella ornithocola]